MLDYAKLQVHGGMPISSCRQPQPAAPPCLSDIHSKLAQQSEIEVDNHHKHQLED